MQIVIPIRSFPTPTHQNRVQKRKTGQKKAHGLSTQNKACVKTMRKKYSKQKTLSFFFDTKEKRKKTSNKKQTEKIKQGSTIPHTKLRFV